ncbi:MAG: tetratricopeptide repeat protein [Verrucomicrobiota bacterium]
MKIFPFVFCLVAVALSPLALTAQEAAPAVTVEHSVSALEPATSPDGNMVATVTRQGNEDVLLLSKTADPTHRVASQRYSQGVLSLEWAEDSAALVVGFPDERGSQADVLTQRNGTWVQLPATTPPLEGRLRYQYLGAVFREGTVQLSYKVSQLDDDDQLLAFGVCAFDLKLASGQRVLRAYRDMNAQSFQTVNPNPGTPAAAPSVPDNVAPAPAVVESPAPPATPTTARLQGLQPMEGMNPKNVTANPTSSDAAARQGFEALRQGDLETAMKRFNQAYLFNENSPIAFWGFGAVLGQRALKQNTEANLKKAIQMFERGLIHARGKVRARMQGDFGLAYTRLAVYYRQQNDTEQMERAFDEAGQLFKQAYQGARNYPPVAANYSLYYYYRGNYRQAKTMADLAVKRGYKFDPRYLQDLKEALRR